MKKKIQIYPTILFGISGFMFSVLGVILNLVCGSFVKKSIVPYTNIITPIINGTCALLCLFYIFTPKKTLFSLIILSTQSVYDVLTGFEILGIFHFFLINLILFYNNFYNTKTKLKLSSIFILWVLLLTTLFSFSINRFVFAFATTIFMTSSFIYIYFLLFKKISFMLLREKNTSFQQKITNLMPGSLLDLSNFNLSDRQIKCLVDSVYNNLSYKQIAEKKCISESVIKKEMQSVFEIFDVENKEQLKILLTPYKLTFKNQNYYT